MTFGKPLAAEQRQQKAPGGVSFGLLAALLVLGVGLTVADAYILEKFESAPRAVASVIPAWRNIAANLMQHLASALIVASIIGFTYEWLLHKRREEEIQLFVEHVTKAHFKALEDFAYLTPRGIFKLLEEIATQTSKIPTLYVPAREDGNEFTFAKSRIFFERLIYQKREEVIGVLNEWIASGVTNLRFLASDFVGEYRLQECAETLRDRAQTRLRDWNNITTNEDKSCILNYVWAASRCEEPKYVWLGKLLSETDDDFVQHWILFVPLQMQDPELYGVISTYLKERGSTISTERRLQVIKALAALGKDNRKDKAYGTIKEFAQLFKEPTLLKELNSGFWKGLNLAGSFAENLRARLRPAHRGTS